LGEILKVTPEHLKTAATTIDGESSSVSGATVPDPSSAVGKLSGFATASVLQNAHDRTASALTVVSKRFSTMGTLLRDTGDTFALMDMVNPSLVTPELMSDKVGDGLAAMGDLNATIPVRMS